NRGRASAVAVLVQAFDVAGSDDFPFSRRQLDFLGPNSVSVPLLRAAAHNGDHSVVPLAIYPAQTESQVVPLRHRRVRDGIGNPEERLLTRIMIQPGGVDPGVSSSGLQDPNRE